MPGGPVNQPSLKILVRGPTGPRAPPAQKPDVFAGGTMRAVSELELPISTTITGALLIIEPGALRALHWHPNAAEWQLYLKGSGRMTVFGSHGRVRTDEFSAGDVGYVPQGYGHYIENTGSDTLEIVLALKTTRPISRSRSQRGWRPIPTFCCRPISAFLRACSPSSPRPRWSCRNSARLLGEFAREFCRAHWRRQYCCLAGP